MSDELPLGWRPTHGIKFPLQYKEYCFETYQEYHDYIQAHFDSNVRKAFTKDI